MRLKGVNMLDKFVVQLEWTDAWVDLTDEEMGILFRKFISHAKGEEMEIKNRMVKNSWLSKVNDIDRMTQKYLKDIENGKKGGAPKGNKNASKQPPNNPQTTQEQPNLNGEMLLKTTENNPNTTYKYKEKYKLKDIDTNITTNRTSGEIFNKVEEQELFECFIKDGYSVEDSIQLTKDALYILN